jgi:uncharacterized protein DUF1800
MAQAIAYLGEPLFGHQAPNGYPETGDAWMNTGAILNRINFGMAVAANRFPGVSIAALPGIDTLRNAARGSQVDAVISILLSGSASPDTRAVLMKGENPLTANAPQTASVETSMTNPGMDGEQMAPVAQARGGKGGVGLRANQGARGFGPVPQLNGVAQIVGLALGSPEFQRR